MLLLIFIVIISIIIIKIAQKFYILFYILFLHSEKDILSIGFEIFSHHNS